MSVPPPKYPTGFAKVWQDLLAVRDLTLEAAIGFLLILVEVVTIVLSWLARFFSPPPR